MKYMVIKETEPVLMIMRPYQIYAVKQALERILDANTNGYIFGCTGCGKTFTSYKLATLLRKNKRIDRVFFLIDRKDLDDQTVEEYNSFEPGCVDNTDSTKELIEAIKDSDKTLIITTIQKLANALRNEKYADVMDTIKDKKCVFIIDECHRSQFGKMHGNIKRHFKNANYIGFTGTPIMKENKGPDGLTTADMFSSGKLDPCIHEYCIKEAIADGNVLRFSVEYMRSVNVKSTIDPTIDVSQLDDPEYCRIHNIDMSGLYHNKQRIEFVSNDILKNLNRHTRPTGKDVYTAIFAVDQIQTLMKYYRYMKNHNPENKKIAAIFTYQANEEIDEGQDNYSSEYLKECMDDYNAMFGTSFDLSTFDAYRKDIAKRLKQKEIPQVDLLLVVNMFLTGFDSKATNTLILDKDLKWHSLVQAYSRTNRVHKSSKQFGQIITYRNIKKAQDEALKLFSGDGNPNDYLLESYEYYVSKYREKVEELRNIAPTPDDAGELINEDDQRAFVITFRNLSNILATLKTFSKFDWTDLDIFMNEEEYCEYKSWYLTFYDEYKKMIEKGGSTTLVDVDFEIELIRTDKINVVYILNLLKEINRSDKEEMEKSIDLILREIERSDNEKLRYKQEIMKSFIKERFFELDENADVEIAFEEYEKEVLQKAVEEFSQENTIDKNIVLDIMNAYFVNEKSVNKELIRNKIQKYGLGLIKTTLMTDLILAFIKEMYNKFTAEGI